MDKPEHGQTGREIELQAAPGNPKGSSENLDRPAIISDSIFRRIARSLRDFDIEWGAGILTVCCGLAVVGVHSGVLNSTGRSRQTLEGDLTTLNNTLNVLAAKDLERALEEKLDSLGGLLSTMRESNSGFVDPKCPQARELLTGAQLNFYALDDMPFSSGSFAQKKEVIRRILFLRTAMANAGCLNPDKQGTSK